MRVRLTFTAITGAALLAVPLLTTGSPAAAAARPLPGTSPLVLHGAYVLGAAPATTRQRVTLALALRDQVGLDQLLAAQQRPGNTSYQRWLTPAQFADRFAPGTAAVSTARQWAVTAGLSVTDVTSNRTLVTVEGTRAQLGKAFGTSLQAVRLGSRTYVTPTRTAVLPVALRTVTASVLGLTTYSADRRPTLTARAAAPYQPYGSAVYGPRDFWRIYHAPAATTGTGQTVSVITDGNLSGVRKDLLTFQTRNRLPTLPLTVVQANSVSTDTSGAEEYDLDTQYAFGFAPGVRALYAYNGNGLGDIKPLNRFVTDRTSLTASASYGGCETIDYAVGEVTADDQVFKQATAQGQSFLFSSGDEGSSCSVLLNTGTPAGLPDVEYPSSSPYVVAVGGTTLTGQATQPLREIAWIGGGGGYSVLEHAAAWQKSEATFVAAVGRGVPDVSLDADPNSGYRVVVAGKDTAIGGTSASAPAWNGIWARVLQRHPRVGFAAPVLYRSRAGFVDITVGSNGIYPTTSGFDLTTGLGSADITALVAAAH